MTEVRTLLLFSRPLGDLDCRFIVRSLYHSLQVAEEILGRHLGDNLLGSVPQFSIGGPEVSELSIPTYVAPNIPSVPE